MRLSIMARVTAAVAATAIAELADKIFDAMGLTEDEARLYRELIKAAAAAVAALLVERMVAGPGRR